MPARSCQCPERRAPIASRRWEICSKPGDGTTVIRCKSCGAIWTTRAKFAEALPYDIGPVTLPRDAFQHTRAIVALTMLMLCSTSSGPLSKISQKSCATSTKCGKSSKPAGNPSANAGLRQAHDETSMRPAMPCTRATAFRQTRRRR